MAKPHVKYSVEMASNAHWTPSENDHATSNLVFSFAANEAVRAGIVVNYRLHIEVITSILLLSRLLHHQQKHDKQQHDNAPYHLPARGVGRGRA